VRAVRRFVALGAVVAAVAASSAAADPNDPAWPQQWGSVTVHLPDAWRATVGDPRVVIAVVDTGLRTTPDAPTNLAPGWNFVDGNSNTDDTWGHGTQVTSVLAAPGDNGVGISGVCWKCTIMPIRVAVQRNVTQSAIAQGIQYAVDHGARIVNVSFAAAAPVSSDLASAVSYAEAHNVLVVAAAGNSGDSTPVFPAALPGVLAVAATDPTNQLYSWSARGDWVALASPGCQVVYDPWVGPASICGTSFSPPVVAGIAGLLLSANPSLSATQIASALEATASPVPGVHYGLVNAASALAYVGAPPPPAPAPAPAPAAGGQTSTSTPPSGSAAGAQPQAAAVHREVRLQYGRLTPTRVVVVRVRKTMLDVQLVSTAAPRCTLTIDSNSFAAISLPADQNVLSLTTPVPAGRYRVTLSCLRPRSTPYSLSIAAAFAGG